jgi:hypothetical protein
MRIEATLANLLASTTRTRGRLLRLVCILALLLTLPASPASAQEGDWYQQFEGRTQGEAAHTLAADSTGLYVAGCTGGMLSGSSSAGGEAAFVRKYDKSGNVLWTRQFGSSNACAVDVTSDSGEIYGVGFTTGALPGQTDGGGEDAFVRKYDRSGNVLWTRQFGSGVDDRAYGVTTDSTGVYAVGYTGGTLPGQTSAGKHDIFVRKYDRSGNVVWTRQFGTSDTDAAQEIASDHTGIYVSGGTMGALPGQTSAGTTDAFVRKYDPFGNELWTRQFGTSAVDAIWDIHDSSAGIYVGGTTEAALPGQVSAGKQDAFLRSYDPSGNVLWTRQFGTAAYDWIRAVRADSMVVHVAGDTHGALPGQTHGGQGDPFVRKYDNRGNELWTEQFGGGEYTEFHSDASLALVVDSTAMYLAGYRMYLSGGGGGFSIDDLDAWVRKLMPRVAPVAPTAPELPSGSDSGASDTDNITNINTPKLFGNAEAGTTVTILVDGVEKGSTVADSSGTYNLATSPLADGKHTITATATNAAGQVSQASQPLNIQVDTVAPAAPRIDRPADGSYDTDGSITFSGSAEANSAVELLDRGRALESGMADGSGAWNFTLTSVPEGRHSYSTRTTDAAGNTSTGSAVAVTVDKTDPDTSIESGPSGFTNDSTPSFGFSGTDNLTASGSLRYSYRFGASAWSQPSTATSVTLGGAAGLPDGEYTFEVRAHDEAGRVDASSVQRSFTVDTVAPAIPSVPDLAGGSDRGASSTDNVTNDSTPTFIGTTEAATTVRILVDGVEKGGVANSTGTYSLTTSTLADGKRYVRAVAQDLAGNRSEPSAALGITIDTKKPVAKAPVQLLAASAQLGTTAVPVKLTWSATDQGTRVERYALAKSRDHITWSGVRLPSLLAKSVSVPLEPAGGYIFRAQARDLAGNWGDWAEGHVFDVIPYQEDSTEITYTGAWTRVADTNAYGGYTNTSTEVGAKATFTFADVENIGVVMPRRSDLGVVRICLDPGTATENCGNVDLSPSTTSLLGNRKLVWVRNNLDLNVPQRTVSITVVSGRVDLDAIVYLGNPGSSL